MARDVTNNNKPQISELECNCIITFWAKAPVVRPGTLAQKLLAKLWGVALHNVIATYDAELSFIHSLCLHKKNLLEICVVITKNCICAHMKTPKFFCKEKKKRLNWEYWYKWLKLKCLHGVLQQPNGKHNNNNKNITSEVLIQFTCIHYVKWPCSVHSYGISITWHIV